MDLSESALSRRAGTRSTESVDATRPPGLPAALLHAGAAGSSRLISPWIAVERRSRGGALFDLSRRGGVYYGWSECRPETLRRTAVALAATPAPPSGPVRPHFCPAWRLAHHVALTFLARSCSRRSCVGIVLGIALDRGGPFVSAQATRTVGTPRRPPPRDSAAGAVAGEGERRGGPLSATRAAVRAVRAGQPDVRAGGEGGLAGGRPHRRPEDEPGRGAAASPPLRGDRLGGDRPRATAGAASTS